MWRFFWGSSYHKISAVSSHWVQLSWNKASGRLEGWLHGAGSSWGFRLSTLEEGAIVLPVWHICAPETQLCEVLPWLGWVPSSQGQPFQTTLMWVPPALPSPPSLFLSSPLLCFLLLPSSSSISTLSLFSVFSLFLPPFLSFMRQSLMYPKPASNFMYIQAWPWTYMFLPLPPPKWWDCKCVHYASFFIWFCRWNPGLHEGFASTLPTLPNPTVFIFYIHRLSEA